MAILRPASTALAAALKGGVELWSADLFTFTLADGVTVFRWTSWDTDLTVAGQTYLSNTPWIKRSKWNVANTMEVPSMQVFLFDLGGSFNGGSAVITQLTQGLFDGATFLCSRVYMATPNDVVALGTIDLFGGVTAGVDLIETTATIAVKGKNNKLDQFAPRNVLAVNCNHAFCDVGCTLSRVAFTTAFTMGAAPTAVFVPWASAPADPTLYIGGTVAVTSGVASGARRTVVNADATGLTLIYPFYAVPSIGDTFTAFQGCDKTFNSGSGRSCTDRSNTQNYRGFEFVPPPSTAL